MKAVGGAGSGGPGPTDEGAVAMLLQLGKMMYEQKLQDKTPVSNEHKKPAQKRQGVRRYPQAGTSSAVSATAAARKKKDYVALNIEKYSSSYSRRKKPPVPQRKNVTSSRVSRTAPRRNALRSWSAPEVPARPASRGAGRAAPPTASAEPMVHKTRGDVVMHYPFCDDAATVGDLLRSDPANTANGDGTSPSSAFQDLPPPLQRKMIHRVFEEYRVSKTSMRVSDISESLKVCGIYYFNTYIYHYFLFAHLLLYISPRVGSGVTGLSQGEGWRGRCIRECRLCGAVALDLYRYGRRGESR